MELEVAVEQLPPNGDKSCVLLSKLLCGACACRLCMSNFKIGGALKFIKALHLPPDTRPPVEQQPTIRSHPSDIPSPRTGITHAYAPAAV